MTSAPNDSFLSLDQDTPDYSIIKDFISWANLNPHVHYP